MFAADAAANVVLLVARGWRGLPIPVGAAENLKNLGERGVVFSRAYCASPKPELAQAALSSSRFPHSATLHDPALGGLQEVPLKSAFEKTPFAVRIALASRGGPGMGMFPLRGNVPPDNEAQARGDLANYFGACRNNDALAGEILDALDRRNLARDTIVCFTSDCGQQLGSHGLDGAEVPFEESVRIPLAIRYPRKLEPGVRDLASQVDIMPTLLALRGDEIPEGVQGIDLFGKTSREVVFAEGKFGTPEEWRVLVRGYDKIVATPQGGVTGLFNLADDPLEMNNLVRDPAQKLRLASLKAQLLAEQKKLGDGMDPSGLRRR
jgi:arylsulfatase A-like enzyme